MRRFHVLPLVLPLVLAAASYVGCSSSNSGTQSYGGGTATGGAAGSGGSNTDASVGGSAGSVTGGNGGSNTGGSNTGGSSTGGSSTDAGNTGGGGAMQDAMPDVDFSYDAPSYDAPEACATAAVEASLKPLDLYMMIDRSGSMAQNSKWTNQSNALKSFFTDPQSAGITVALRFFPLNDNSSPQSPTCNGNAYATPLVDWGVLPGHAAALGSAIDGTSPTGLFTPTQEAINGVLKGALTRQQAFPGHVVSAVIVSDGTPCCLASGYGCPVETAAGIGAIAATYFSGTPSIRTFAIYVATDATAVMTAIAQQGGTTQAYDATGGSAAFLAALKAIQGSAIPCDFDMPHPSTGTVDPDQVSLSYLPGGAGNPVPVSRVPDSSACGGGDGWYYDNNANPTKISLCPTTCATMKADPQAKVNIATGCLGS